MNTDDQLKKLIQSAGIESPSDPFTSNVMEKVSLQRETITVKPVNGKAGWIVFGFLILVFLIAALVPGNNHDSFSLPGFNFKPASDTFFLSLNRISEMLLSSKIIVLAVISAGVLFILDYLFTDKFSKMRKI